jgi:hypothetical protein
VRTNKSEVKHCHSAQQQGQTFGHPGLTVCVLRATGNWTALMAAVPTGTAATAAHDAVANGSAMIMTPRVPPPLAATSWAVGSGPSDSSTVFARRQARLARSFFVHPPSPLGSFPGHWQPVPSWPGGTSPPATFAGGQDRCLHPEQAWMPVRQARPRDHARH